MPTIQTGSARISAIKWAESKASLILRLVEFRGQGGMVKLHIPPGTRYAAKVNLLEERAPQELEIHEQTIGLSLRPWEIATIKLVQSTIITSAS